MFYRQEIPSLCLCCTQVLWPCSQVFSSHNITDRDAQSLSGLVCYYNRHTFTPTFMAGSVHLTPKWFMEMHIISLAVTTLSYW